jgi:hypothetical protein
LIACSVRSQTDQRADPSGGGPLTSATNAERCVLSNRGLAPE